MNHRSQLIDVAKGIGILFVVFGHSPFVAQSRGGEIFNIIFSFHMPLFFFLAGVFCNPNISFKKIFIKKGDSLLKPYFTTLFLVGLKDILFDNKKFFPILINSFYGTGGTIEWITLWFLPHLFVVSIFCWFLVNVTKKIDNKNFLLLLAITFLIIGVKSINNFWYADIILFNKKYILPGLPFSIDILCVTTFYYLLGYYFSEQTRSFKPKVPFTLVSLALFSTCHYYFDQTIDLNFRIFQGLWIPTIQSLSAIYIILSLSYFLQKNFFIKKNLSIIGLSSLFILIFHFFFQIKAYDIALRITQETVFLAVFLAFLAGVAVPMLIRFLVKKNNFLSLFYLPLKYNSKVK